MSDKGSSQLDISKNTAALNAEEKQNIQSAEFHQSLHSLLNNWFNQGVKAPHELNK